jgi:hypothetical protein
MMNEYGDRLSAKKAGLSKKARKALASDTKPKTKKKKPLSKAQQDRQERYMKAIAGRKGEDY